MKFFEIDEEYLKKGGLITREAYKNGLSYGLYCNCLVAFQYGEVCLPINKFVGYKNDLLANDWKYIEYKNSKKWKPEYGDRYYFIDCMNLCNYYTYANDEVDNALLIIGNCFKSEEVAKHMVEKLKIITKLRELATIDFYDNHTDGKFVIYYDSTLKQIKIDKHEYIRELPFNIYFATKEDCQKAIDIIGKENLKKYYFEVDD